MELNFDRQIRPLSLAALIAAAISCIEYFVYYIFVYKADGFAYEMHVSIPDLGEFILLLMKMSPVVLMFLYFSRFYIQCKGMLLLPIACGLVGINAILFYIYRLINGYFNVSGISVLSDVLTVAFSVLLVINSIKGLRVKMLTLSAAGAGGTAVVIKLILYLGNIGYYVEEDLFSYLLTDIAGIVAVAALGAALVLFALNNTVPVLTEVYGKKTIETDEVSCEEYILKLLNDKLASGSITAEEYKRQRDEIIKQL